MKFKRKMLLVIALVTIDLLSMFLFSHYPGLFFPWYRSFSKNLMSLMSMIASVAPFSLWDIALLLIVIYELYRLFKDRNFSDWFSKMLLVVTSVCSFVILGWMLNHYAPPLSSCLDLEVRPSEILELYEATEYYLKEAVLSSFEVERNGEGQILIDSDRLYKETGSAYKKLDNAVFQGSAAPTKHFSLIGDYLLYNGITGMFMPFTGEASIPSHVPLIDQAFCLTHEVAHRLGIASEQEANFAAYLACVHVDDKYFIYSGQYSAFFYCYNALYSQNPELARELINNVSDELSSTNEMADPLYYLLLDNNEARDVYSSYQSPLEKVSDKINDTYLKSFGQESGIRSYGEVVDYLLAYYRFLNNR